MCLVSILNINSTRNKFSSVPHLIDKNLNIFAIAETKLDSPFPGSQFILPGMRMKNFPVKDSRKLSLISED